MGDDLIRGRGRTGLEGDERFRDLAPIVVGDGDDRDFEDGRMGVDRLLDLDGRDVLTAADNDVLLPIAELPLAVGVHHRQVAGVEPAAADGRRG
ncbi:MAG: hypothetical protein QOJ59_4082, partial [Thermomicrobiales bacterium]|nr:hypothetical protein [Thermomicrobiales bacterium]